MNRVIISLALMFVTSCLLPGQPRKRMSDEKGREAISRFLAKTQGPQGGQILSIDDDPVVKAFSFQRFYTLHFRRYPVAPALPESLTYNNLLVLYANENVELIRDTNALEAFFRPQLLRVVSEAQARNVVKAWLRLTQEFHQDGFFQFSIPDGGILVLHESGSIRASGKEDVVSDYGNSGGIAVSLSFDSAGKLMDVKETANVIAGRRPNF